MSDIADKVKMSRGAGFDDAQILDFLSKQPDYREKVAASRATGQSDKDIVEFLASDRAEKAPPLSLERTGGSLARGAAEGLIDTATLPYRLLGGGKDVDKVRKGLLSSAPTPTGPIEKLAEGAGEGIGSTLPGLGVGAGLARTGVKPLVKVGEFLAGGPKTQLAGGAVGGAVDEATDKPGTGAAASAAVPLLEAMGRKVATPNLSHLTGDEFRLRDLAKSMGIPLTAADRTGNKVLHQAEGVLRTLPGSAGVMQKADTAQREALNNEILKVAGINAPYATPAVLDKGQKQIGNEMGQLAKLSSGAMDRQFATDVDRVIYDYGTRLDTDVMPAFKSYIDDLAPHLIAARSGQASPTALTGERYDEIRKSISLRMRKTKDPFFKDALDGLRDALDGAMERSSGPAVQQAWQNARKRYAALMTVEDAMNRGTAEDRTKGNIPLTGFAAAVRGSDRPGYATGKGQYNDLARVAEFLAPKVPTSGTAERTNMTNMLKGGGLASALTYGATTGDVISPTVALATPYLAGKAYNTDAITNWLSRQGVAQKGLVRILAEAARGGVPQAAREAAEK